jgi:prevent-host-death family protein
MLRQITLHEANQRLSHYIDEVEHGVEIVITRRGQPVARLLPILQKRELTATQLKAWQKLLPQLRKGYHLGKKKFQRGQTYRE